MKILLEFDANNFTYTDEYLAALWHAAQWNSAAAADPEACRLVERIGREIISRWLKATPPTLWNRQGTHQQSLPHIEQQAEVRNVLVAACAVAASFGRKINGNSVEISAEPLDHLVKSIEIMEAKRP